MAATSPNMVHMQCDPLAVDFVTDNPSSSPPLTRSLPVTMTTKASLSVSYVQSVYTLEAISQLSPSHTWHPLSFTVTEQGFYVLSQANVSNTKGSAWYKNILPFLSAQQLGNKSRQKWFENFALGVWRAQGGDNCGEHYGSLQEAINCHHLPSTHPSRCSNRDPRTSAWAVSHLLCCWYHSKRQLSKN